MKRKVAFAISSSEYSWRSVRRGRPRTPMTTTESPTLTTTRGGASRRSLACGLGSSRIQHPAKPQPWPHRRSAVDVRWFLHHRTSSRRGQNQRKFFSWFSASHSFQKATCALHHDPIMTYSASSKPPRVTLQNKCKPEPSQRASLIRARFSEKPRKSAINIMKRTKKALSKECFLQDILSS